MQKSRFILIIITLAIIAVTLQYCGSRKEQSVRDTSSEMVDKYMPARNYLEKGNDEEEGFGLYSYILFTQRPEKDDSVKYAELIKTYMNKIPELSDLTEYLEDSSINVVYYPTISDPENYLDTLTIDESIKWLINNYDYARAIVYLRKIDADINKGPYIISYKVPLSKSGVVKENFLLQDFSNVHYKVVSLWVDEFLEQSSQVEYWNEEQLKNFSNDLRNAIAIGAEGLIEIKKSFGWWEENLQGWIVFRN